MKKCELNGSRSGGISVNGGDVNMSECVFDRTAPITKGFESVQRNLLCNNANITMNGYNGQTINKNTSLWIVIGNCLFETSEEKPESLLYVPILNGVRYDGERYLTFYGKIIIGCNLSYEIFMDGQLFTFNPVPLNGAESPNDSIVSHAVTNALFRGMNYTARLLYGVNGTTEGRRILWPGEEYEEEDTEGGRSRRSGAVIGIVIVVLVVAVGIGVSVGVYVKKKKGSQRRKANDTETYMTTNLVDLDEEKGMEAGEKEVDKADRNLSSDISFSSSSSTEWNESNSEGREEEGDEQEDMNTNENGTSSSLTSNSTGILTTSDGKSLNVGSDVQWPLSEEMYRRQSMSSIRWR